MAKRAKKEGEKTVSIFLDFALATAGIIVGAGVGVIVISLLVYGIEGMAERLKKR
jgi:hypothetical protein